MFDEVMSIHKQDKLINSQYHVIMPNLAKWILFS